MRSLIGVRLENSGKSPVSAPIKSRKRQIDNKVKRAKTGSKP